MHGKFDYLDEPSSHAMISSDVLILLNFNSVFRKGIPGSCKLIGHMIMKIPPLPLFLIHGLVIIYKKGTKPRRKQCLLRSVKLKKKSAKCK